MPNRRRLFSKTHGNDKKRERERGDSPREKKTPRRKKRRPNTTKTGLKPTGKESHSPRRRLHAAITTRKTRRERDTVRRQARGRRKHTLRSTKRKRPNKRQKGKVRNGGIEIEVGETEKATTSVVSGEKCARKKRKKPDKKSEREQTHKSKKGNPHQLAKRFVRRKNLERHASELTLTRRGRTKHPRTKRRKRPATVSTKLKRTTHAPTTTTSTTRKQKQTKRTVSTRLTLRKTEICNFSNNSDTSAEVQEEMTRRKHKEKAKKRTNEQH